MGLVNEMDEVDKALNVFERDKVYVKKWLTFKVNSTFDSYFGLQHQNIVFNGIHVVFHASLESIDDFFIFRSCRL